MLDVLGNKAGSVFRSGSVPLTRPLSSGKQTYDTIPIEWPLTQPMTKVEAINQVGLFYVPLKKHHGMLLPNVGLLSCLASNKNWNSLLGSKLLYPIVKLVAEGIGHHYFFLHVCGCLCVFVGLFVRL